MKVQERYNSIEFTWENSFEKNYLLNTVLDRVHFIYDPTYIVFVNGVKIEGKEQK